MARIGFLHSLIRRDEKLLLEEFEKCSQHEIVMLDDRKLVFDLEDRWIDVDLVLERCIHHGRAMNALQLFENQGVRCINSASCAEICGDRLLTSAVLNEHDVAQPEVRVAFTEESALSALEELGYPVVFKPAIGSWGKLLAKADNRFAAESIMEHKTTLGSFHHSVFYMQKFVEMKRDLRTFVVGDECVAAISRKADHWISDISRGADYSKHEVTPELAEVSLRAAKAVGGDIVSVDIFETEGGYLVNDVNYTIEFQYSIEPTGINIPQRIVQHVVRLAGGEDE